jgi:hypothetical protein
MDLSVAPAGGGKPVPLFNYKTVKMPEGYITNNTGKVLTAEDAEEKRRGNLKLKSLFWF